MLQKLQGFLIELHPNRDKRRVLRIQLLKRKYYRLYPKLDAELDRLIGRMASYTESSTSSGLNSLTTDSVAHNNLCVIYLLSAQGVSRAIAGLVQERESFRQIMIQACRIAGRDPFRTLQGADTVGDRFQLRIVKAMNDFQGAIKVTRECRENLESKNLGQWPEDLE